MLEFPSSDRSPVRGLLPLVLAGAVVAVVGSGAGSAQSPSANNAPVPSSADQPALDPQVRTAPASPIKDPYRAYEAGQYQQALTGLIDLQVEHPEDPDLLLGVGSAQYQLKDFEASERSYARAAQATDPRQRAEALYNLGNAAYRQGRLLEAVDRYVAALDLAPDDEDAKFNLEFVREEIRRRQEEAEKRQQEQQQNEQQQDGGDQQQDQGEGNGQQQGSEEPPEGGQDADTDGDGLPDEVERMGRNPTDPENPDTDGDGRPDGQEDANQNGQLDPGETDPNLPDGEGGEQPPSEPEDQSQGSAEQPAPSAAGEREMTEAEAERYLQALEERRPNEPERARPARRTKVEKDW